VNRLIKDVNGGVSLLVFVLRGPGGPREEQLETEENMNDWWFAHNGVFQRSGTHLAGYACITACKGKLRRSGEYCYEGEYRESRDKLWTAIWAFSLREPVVFKG